MKNRKQNLVLTVAAVVALICSASDIGPPSFSEAEIAAQSAADQFGVWAAYSLAQWQPASGYVAVNYPTNGSWQQVMASVGQ